MPASTRPVRGTSTRGRGRGRGNIAQATSSSDGQAGNDGESQTHATEDVSMTDAEPAEAITPTVNTPTTILPSSEAQSSPATATTAPTTAASTSRPPVQRLSSIRGALGSASPSPSARGAKRAIAAPKFVGRRSKEERAALEASQNAKRAAEAKVANAREKRGGFQRGRGGARGGYMGDRRKDGAVASGPFSMGTVGSDGYGRRRPTGTPLGGMGGGFGIGAGGGGGGGGGYGGSSSGGGSSSKIKKESGEPGLYTMGNNDLSDSSDDDGENQPPRKDIDSIDLISDDEGPSTNKRSNGAGKAPVRVHRTEHKDRNQTAISSEKSKQDAEQAMDDLDDDADISTSLPSPTATKKGKQRAKDVEVVSAERRWKGAWSESESEAEEAPAIKAEPQEEAVTALPMDVDGQPHVSGKEPSSPRKARARRKAAMPDLQTAEERREYERHELDLDTLRDELGTIEPETDANGDTTMAGAAPDQRDGLRTDRVYLFQFPPVLPDLKVTNPIKPEPQSPELARKDKSLNSQTAPLDLDAIPPVGTTPANNTADTSIKVEEDAVNGASDTGMPKLASGAVGKLRIHASGKATLDWGGTSLQLGMGTDITFLQDVLLARMFDPATKEGDEAQGMSDGKKFGGEAKALGQIRGKFVVTPDWAEIV